MMRFRGQTTQPAIHFVRIDGVDGILLKTMHASVALEAGAKLVFCITPLVPVDTRRAVRATPAFSATLGAISQRAASTTRSAPSQAAAVSSGSC